MQGRGSVTAAHFFFCRDARTTVTVGKLDAGPCGLFGLEENEFMGVGDDHEGVLAFLLREPDGEVLEDCAKMNLGDLQRRGDVLELLALLSGNAVIRKEHE